MHPLTCNSHSHHITVESNGKGIHYTQQYSILDLVIPGADVEAAMDALIHDIPGMGWMSVKQNSAGYRL